MLTLKHLGEQLLSGTIDFVLKYIQKLLQLVFLHEQFIAHLKLNLCEHRRARAIALAKFLALL